MVLIWFAVVLVPGDFCSFLMLPFNPRSAGNTGNRPKSQHLSSDMVPIASWYLDDIRRERRGPRHSEKTGNPKDTDIHHILIHPGLRPTIQTQNESRHQTKAAKRQHEENNHLSDVAVTVQKCLTVEHSFGHCQNKQNRQTFNFSIMFPETSRRS